jgi:hypothetical protein
MIQARHERRDTADRQALRRRVRQMYEWFNQGAWEKCYSLLDRRLREGNRIEEESYVDSLKRFKQVYGRIDPWYVRLSLHLEGASKQKDARPFAYVYVVWQDQAREFHMFRERWVQDSGRWYTRVAGLVAQEKNKSLLAWFHPCKLLESFK